MAVMFDGAEQSAKEAVVLSLRDAAALGYYVSLHTSRLTLRCYYSSPLSYSVQVPYGFARTWPVAFTCL